MTKQLAWKAVGKSVQGASHIRKNMPCQDYIFIKQLDEAVILSLADGHGSSRSPYSDEGAKIAVNIAVEIFEQIYDDYKNSNKNLSIIKQFSDEQLKRLLVRRWREEVKKSYDIRTQTEDIGENCDDFYVKYGSTVIAVLATSDFILALQLGDGDILQVSKDGKASLVIEKDEKLVGVETTSLCTKDAWKDVNVVLSRLIVTKNDISMLMLSSDGYYNSFANDNSYFKSANEYLRLIDEYGLEKVSGNLENWLNEISVNGCGDDITLGIIYLI